MYAYAGNNPVKYTDPDGNDIIFSTFWNTLASSCSGADRIIAHGMAASAGSEASKNVLSDISLQTRNAMEEAAGCAIIKGMECATNYGPIMAVAAYASGNIFIGFMIDGVVAACDITLAINEYNNSDHSATSLAKTITDIASTLGMTLGASSLYGKYAAKAFGRLGEIAFEQSVQQAVGEVMGNLSDAAIDDLCRVIISQTKQQKDEND